MKRSGPSDPTCEDTCSTSTRALHPKRARVDVLQVPSQVRSSHQLRENARDEPGSRGNIITSFPEDRISRSHGNSHNHRRAISAPPDRTVCTDARALGTSRTIAEISRKAAELSKKQRDHMAAADRLQQRVIHGEKALGEHLRDSLRIQRALQDQRERNRIDKQELDDVRARSRAIADELDQLLREMQVLSQHE